MVGLIPGGSRRMQSRSTFTDSSSKISTNHIYNIIEKLKCCKKRELTKANYLGIWRQFNRFINQLDVLPQRWKQRATLFAAYLVDQGLQSSTIKSYMSAIKCILIDDNYDWVDEQILLNTLTRVCRKVNDRVFIRRPIK